MIASKFVDEIKLFTDGGSRGNPGPSAIAVLVVDRTGAELELAAECIGQQTNNSAEYMALIEGLRRSAKHTNKRVDVRMDSELVVNQLNKRYRVKDRHLQDLFLEVKRNEAFFDRVTYTHVPRSHPGIQKVDAALNDALDGK